MKKEIVNESRFAFPALSRNESLARAVASAFSAQADPTVEELSAIKMAVSEAVTNAIVHGYRDSIGSVEMTLRLYSDSTVYIAVKDRGRGIADVNQAMQPMFTTAPAEEERSGLGFTVMESFMDKVRVKSRPGRGTSVVLEKHISGREHSGDKR